MSNDRRENRFKRMRITIPFGLLALARKALQCLQPSAAGRHRFRWGVVVVLSLRSTRRGRPRHRCLHVLNELHRTMQ